MLPCPNQRNMRNERMNLNQFCQKANVLQKRELEKVRLLAFFSQKTSAKKGFSIEDACGWFKDLSLPMPNRSRLRKRIQQSREFIKDDAFSSFRLHAVEFDALQAEYPRIHIQSEDVISDDTILPVSLYTNTRGFVESPAKQINASYEYNIFDGCAVLMRRLFEVLLILAYENLDIDSEIQDKDKNYFSFEKIIANAVSNRALKITKKSKFTLEKFRILGNFSAHKIYYNCRKSELERLIPDYRAAFEELLYKSGIKK